MTRFNVNDWLVPVLAGLVLGLLVMLFRGWPAITSTAQPTLAKSYHAVIEKALPFSVSITSFHAEQNSLTDDLNNDPVLGKYIAPNHQQQTSLGSGILLTQDGWVVTNAHVIKNAQNILVQTYTNQLSPVHSILIDPETDIAVLKTDLATSKPLAFRQPINEQVGDLVFSLGNPFGIGQSASMGIISAQRRAQPSLANLNDFIQTDATINPGNSGGALINSDGLVIGMNTALFSSSGGSQGIGFAIPFDFVVDIATELITTGTISRGFLGIDVEPTVITSPSDPALPAVGLRILSVQSESPAALAGLNSNDIIVELAGMNITQREEAARLVSRLMPGKSVTVKVLREGRLLELQTTLTSKMTN